MIRTVNNAMTQRRAELRNGENDKGFTLIELMVVIIIIGILAAIAIPVFLNQRNSAWEGQVKSDLANAALAAESYAASNGGSYDGLSNTVVGKKLTDFGYKPTDGVTVQVSGTPTSTDYVLTGANSNITGKTWTFTSTDGKTTGPTGP
jgi:type IV pilus assembly protein PilA